MVFSFFIAWLRQAQPPCYSRCLSLSKAEVIFCSSGDLDSAQSPCYFRCLSLSKAEVHLFIWWFRLRSITFLYLLLLPVPEPVEGRFSLIILWFRQAQSPCYSRCLSLSKAHFHSSSCDFDSAQSPSYIYYYSRCLSLSKADSYSSRWFRQAQSPCYFRCLSLSKAHFHSSYP